MIPTDPNGKPPAEVKFSAVRELFGTKARFEATNPEGIVLKIDLAAKNNPSWFAFLIPEEKRGYVWMKTDQEERVYVKVSSVEKKLGWSEENIRKFSKDGTLFQKLKHAASLTFELQKNPELEKNRKLIRDWALSYLEDVNRKDEKVHAVYTLKGKNAVLLTSDPATKTVSIETGNFIGSGTSGSVFGMHDTAVKVTNATPLFMVILGNTLHEKILLEEIHKDGTVRGIQEKLALIPVADIFQQNPSGEVFSFKEELQNDNRGREEQNKIKEEFSITLGPRYEGDLSKFIDKSKQEETYSSIVKSMQQDIAFGLRKMHEGNIVHGDHKPDNIFYRKDRAFIGDFGTASKIDPDTKDSIPELCCTLSHTLIEDKRKYDKLRLQYDELTLQTEGDLKPLKEQGLRLRKQIDIFQIGITFYQTVVKDVTKLPYTMSSDQDAKTWNSDFKRDLESFYGKGDPRVECIVRMISVNPEERPDSLEVNQIFS